VLTSVLHILVKNSLELQKTYYMTYTTTFAIVKSTGRTKEFEQWYALLHYFQMATQRDNLTVFNEKSNMDVLCTPKIYRTKFNFIECKSVYKPVL